MKTDKILIFCAIMTMAWGVARGGAMVHTISPSTDSGTLLIGIFETESGYVPVVYSFSDFDDEYGGLPMVTPLSFATGAPVPTILLAEASRRIPEGLSSPLWVSNRSILPPRIEKRGWIFSKYLGWTYVPHYPQVYVAGRGWMHVVQPDPAVEDFHLYSFETREWEFRALSQHPNPVVIVAVPTEGE